MSLCVECGGDGYCEDDCTRYRKPASYAPAPKGSLVTAFPKQGALRHEGYLSFVRKLLCPCGERPPSFAHHWPIKGRRRDIDDTKTIPVCVSCHKRCHGETVVIRGKRHFPITPAEQDAAVGETLRTFLIKADPELVADVLAKLRAHGAPRIPA